MPNSPQAKQYDAILKKLSRVALSRISETGDQPYENSSLFWSDLFRLTPTHLRKLKEEEEESCSNLSTSRQNGLAVSEGNCPGPSKLGPSQDTAHVDSHMSNLFSFPDGAYKDFSNYTLMTEGLLSEQHDFFLNV